MRDYKVFSGISVEELVSVTNELWNMIDSLPGACPVVLLTGGMGAGKTTFVRKFVHARNPAAIVNSPTFSILNEYEGNDKKIFHFDLYRINSADELDDLGFEEIWGHRGISLVEWWERLPDSWSPIRPLIELEIFFSYDKPERDYILRVSEDSFSG